MHSTKDEVSGEGCTELLVFEEMGFDNYDEVHIS